MTFTGGSLRDVDAEMRRFGEDVLRNLAELLTMGAWPNNPEFPCGWSERDAKGV